MEARVIEVLALAVAISAGLFFVSLGFIALLAPSRASRFLAAFANSPTKHYAELALRFLVGGAFVLVAPEARISELFTLLGWTLLATTAVLMLIPWRWHHSFARRAVPAALRFLPLVGASSVLLGALVLWSLLPGNAV
jgi:uncharacterized protein YjeT (DUF2065 family)